MSNPKFNIEFTVKGINELGGVTTTIHKADFEAANPSEAHSIFQRYSAALELETAVIDIVEHENFREEMDELSQQLTEKLDNIQYQFDQMYKGQKYVDEHQYQALKEWFEDNLESLDVDL